MILRGDKPDQTAGQGLSAGYGYAILLNTQNDYIHPEVTQYFLIITTSRNGTFFMPSANHSGRLSERQRTAA